MTYDPADAIAIVGMAGRFPGASDVDSLWNLLIEGGNAIGPIPADRWDGSARLDPDRQIQAVGGFLDGVDRFDATFFGVSPREAAVLDPQQRLLLETSWRALEDAGTRSADLAGSRTGVYVGASWHDYELLRLERISPSTPHSLVGNALDVIAARLSYHYRLRGPSMTVETGCSSSLVALHLAVQALQQGDIDAALVGATNLMLHPHVTVGLTHFGALSPDGRCATFGAGANGFVRGEGVVALYVKTLARAIADGDRIHGVVVRTAVNNDGGGESLVTPSQDGQEDLLRRAYSGAVSAPIYIEAHGTGTGKGDPIEAAAIGSVLGCHRADDPVRIGSIKTNIGHLEASAGIAGLIKILLAIRHRTLPPSLHSAELNPGIEFAKLGVQVVHEPEHLLSTGPVHMGVSSFGWGGTNAHVVVTGPPDEVGGHADAVAPGNGLTPLLALSAKDGMALAQRATELRGVLMETPGDMAGLAGPLAWRRDHFPVRAAVVPDAASRAAAGLAELAAVAGTARHERPGRWEELETPGVVAGWAVPQGRTAFVFPGQGWQWKGMGYRLYQDCPRFAEVVIRCAEALRPHASWNLLDFFQDSADEAWLTRVDMLQPMLWAVSLGLAEVWRASGVEPDIVVGQSQGEIAAATMAGILSYEDAASIVAQRSAIVRRAAGSGRMLAVELDREAAEAALDGFEDHVALAVHNGPTSCVLSGETDSILVLRELLEAQGVHCRLVNVDYASHSPAMDGLRGDLLTALAAVQPKNACIELRSTVRSRLIDGPEMDAAYWAENLRRPVLFADAIRALFDEGVTHVIEVSANPILTHAIDGVAASRAEPTVVLPTLHRDRGEARDLAMALARAYVTGLEPFGGLPRGYTIPIPGYPLRPQRHWAGERSRSRNAARGLAVELHPAVGQSGTWQGALELSLADLPWLADHRVYDTPVLPGAAVLELALDAARKRTGIVPGVLTDVRFVSPVTLGETPARLTVEWYDNVADGPVFRLLSLAEGAESWEVNATARVGQRAASSAPPLWPDWSSAESTRTSGFYDSCAVRGLGYGPAFQAVQTLLVRKDGSEALGEVSLPERPANSQQPYALHPVLLDGVLQVAIALCDADTALVPTGIQSIRYDLPEAPITTLWSHVTRRGNGLLDVQVFDGRRRPVLTMQGMELTALQGDPQVEDERLHHVEWVPLDPAPTGSSPGRWIVHAPADAAAGMLAAALSASGAVGTVAVDEATELERQFSERPCEGVVFVAPGVGAGLSAQQEGLLRLTAVVRRSIGLGAPPRLAIVTVNGQAAAAGDVPDPGSALYWGYTRVLQREHPELAARLIDVEEGAMRTAAASLAAEILHADGEDQVAHRSGLRLGARITRGETTTRLDQVRMPAAWLRADGTYLISGGLGALGLSLAEFLADNGAGALALLGRSAPDASANVRLTALRERGTRVEVRTCDVADVAAVQQVVADLRDHLPPLRGVCHAAGVLADATIQNLTPQQLSAVFQPKVDGVRHLATATADDPLDVFVLFSSAATLVGNVGQAAYAASNAYLDAFAQARRARGLPALSVQWGPVADTGLAAKVASRGERLEARGMTGVATREMWPALSRMIERGDAVVGYVAVNLRQWFDAYPDLAASFSWQRLLSLSGEEARVSRGRVLAKLTSCDPGDRLGIAEESVRDLTGQVLRMDADSIRPDANFKHLGLDSLMSLELRNRLEATFGLRLPPTLLWAHGSPRAVAMSLCDRLAAVTEPEERS